MKLIKRKTLLYKSGVEYADFCINHIEGCSHGCLYPCYAMMMAKRFGRINSYNDWINPKLVENSLELLKKEIPKYKKYINYVQLCFSTDPFMYGYNEVSDLSIKIIKLLNETNIKCTALTKGILPLELVKLNKINEFGISIVSLNENFRKKYEPYSATYNDRIESLLKLHKKGFKTWVSIEPYPTPNIINQKFDDILESISFADKIIFGKLNYNPLVSKYPNRINYFNKLALKVIDFCEHNNKECHIKEGTLIKQVNNSKEFALA